MLLSRRRPEIYGLAEFKPKLLLSRPEIYSKPAWGLQVMLQCIGLSSFILSSHRSLGLALVLFPSNLACSALCGIRSIGIPSMHIQNIRVFAARLYLNKIVWLPNACNIPREIEIGSDEYMTCFLCFFDFEWK